MGRSPCCSKEGLNKGAWTALEDRMLTTYVNAHGEGGWRNLPKKAGLERCGKSCRLRWLNYLRPDIKRGNISPDEEELILRLHKLLGNRWSLISGRLPGRTDNEIKNYWNTNFGKKNLNAPQSSSQPSKKGLMMSKTKPRKQFNEPKNTVPTNQPQPIRTKAFRCTKVVIQTPSPNYSQLNSNSNSNSNVNSVALNSLDNQHAYQSPQDSCNSKMDIGNESIDVTCCGVYDPKCFDFNAHDLQTSCNNEDAGLSYNLNTNLSNNGSNHHLQFDDLIMDDWIISNTLEENDDMDLGSLAFLLDCEKW